MPFGSGSLKYAAVVTVVVAGDFRRCNFVNNKKVCEQQKECREYSIPAKFPNRKAASTQ
jgi:hypothetical protein